MTREDQLVKKDRMLYTKDSMSANLVLVAIVLDALYFVSITYVTTITNNVELSGIIEDHFCIF